MNSVTMCVIAVAVAWCTGLVMGWVSARRVARKEMLDYYREKRWLRKLSTSDRVITGSSVREEGVVRVVQGRTGRV